jgi:hypothetical protein
MPSSAFAAGLRRNRKYPVRRMADAHQRNHRLGVGANEISLRGGSAITGLIVSSADLLKWEILLKTSTKDLVPGREDNPERKKRIGEVRR